MAARGPEVHRISTAERTLVFRAYVDERDLHASSALISSELSEPYSIFTYRYFLCGWPELCFLAFDAATDQLVGVINGKAEPHRSVSDPSIVRMRGYISMLAVVSDVRRAGVGSALVRLAITAMAKTCDEVVLETEITNASALRLYERQGFIRDKRLPRYYLNGNDAYRLKLWLK